MDSRELKGLEIAAKLKLTRKGNFWLVPSQSGKGKYTVDLNSNPPKCTCQDEIHQVKCKHAYAVEFTIQRQQSGKKKPTSEILEPPTKKTRPTYKQKWNQYNQAQTNEKIIFQKFLHELCRGIPDIERLVGPGQPPLPLSDMLFCAALKVYTRFSSRRFISEAQEAKDKGYITRVPHFNSILKYLAKKELKPIIDQLIADSSLPLAALESETDFSVDSTGLCTSKYVAWFNERYGHVQDNHDWVKLHLSCSAKTHIVAAAIVTDRHANDSPLFPRLITSTVRNFNMKEASGDKAYSSKTNLAVVVGSGATPYIPFKRSATGASGGLWEKLFHYYSFHREEFLQHYHKRSNAESTINMIKSKFDSYLCSKTKTAQINEALLKVLCHNICVLVQSMYELGVQPSLIYGVAQPPVGEDFKVEEYCEQLSFSWK